MSPSRTNNAKDANNAKEGLFARDKRHFRSLCGRREVGPAFQAHAALYSRLVGEDWGEARIREVLLVAETAVVAEGVQALRARYATVRRRWRIRAQDTGNWELLEKNLSALGV